MSPTSTLETQAPHSRLQSFSLTPEGSVDVAVSSLARCPFNAKPLNNSSFIFTSPVQQAAEHAHLKALAQMAMYSEEEEVTEAAAVKSPTTPRATKAPASPPPGRRSTEAPKSPPPHLRNCNKPQPPLLRALTSRSVQNVRAVLENSPEAANELFLDHDCEHPLCAAARCGCSADVMELLLEHRADPGAKDKRGRTPAQIMAQPMPWEKSLSATTSRLGDLTPPWAAGPWSANLASDDFFSGSFDAPLILAGA